MPEINLIAAEQGGVIDIEREIEAKFIYAFRAAFSDDQKFKYDKDEKLSKIVITVDYPEKTVPFKTPHLIVSGVQYQMNMDLSFSQGFQREIRDKTGAYIGSVIARPIGYSLNLSCMAPQSMDKDMANKVVNFMAAIYTKVFINAGLNITSIQKGPSRAVQQYSERIFETSIGIQGTTHWISREFFIDKEKEHFLSAIYTDVTIR